MSVARAGIVLSKERLATLHRHWIWADHCKRAFDKLLPAKFTGQDVNTSLVEPWMMQMCLWYALLYAVIEALRGWRVRIQLPLRARGAADINTIIASIFPGLKLFRNAVLHVQNEYWSPKLWEIMRDRDSAAKIRESHEAIGAWLSNTLQAAEQSSQVDPLITRS